MAGGVDVGNEGAEIGFGEGGAAGGGFGPAAAPDVEEDGRSRAGGRFWWSVVGDEEFEGMRVVVLLHLGFFLPSGLGLVVEDDVAVVVFRGRVLDPEVAAGDFAIGEAGLLFDGGGIAPGSADVKDAGRSAPVAFAFGCSFHAGVDPFAPG